MDAPKAALLVIFLIFLIIAPDSQRSTPLHQHELGRLLHEERHAINLLNTTRFGDFDPLHDKWINVTGLRRDDGYAWDLLPIALSRSRDHLESIIQKWRMIRESSPLLGSLGDGYKSVENFDKDSLVNPSQSDLQSLRIPLFQNVTGIVHGKWIRSAAGAHHRAPLLNLTAIAPHIHYTTEEYTRNITGHEGDLRIKFDEKKSERLVLGQNSVREIRAEMTIKDDSSNGDGWEFTLHGVHYPETGSILLTTSGDKFAGIFALPHFAISPATSLLAQQLLNRTLMASIIRQERSLFVKALYPWSSSPNSPAETVFPTPHCEYVVYLQQHVPTVPGLASPDVYQKLVGLKELEAELRYPTGAPLGPIPAMIMSAVVFSPDCGFVLESKGPPAYSQQDGVHLQGPKIESYLLIVRRSVLTFSLVISAQVYLLMNQMKDTSTPSTRSRISFYTFATMAMGDGFVCMTFMTISMFTDAAFLSMISTAFLAFLCVSFFGMKFLMDIWTVQAPERQDNGRRNARSSSSVEPAGSASGSTNVPTVVVTNPEMGLPLPATAPRPPDARLITNTSRESAATEVQSTAGAQTNAMLTTQNPVQITLGSARREMGALYSRFYFTLMVILFLSLHATSWPRTIRSIYTNLLSFAYLSFWSPQIYRNVIRNCRRALRWEFVIGQSLLRLAPFYYFFAVKGNILFVENDVNALYVLFCWVWLQVLALISQEILGPRFFVPDGWAPPAYDYHPLLREDDEEAGASMPIGFTQARPGGDSPSVTSEGSKQQQGQRTFDCAICMQNLDVPVVPSGSTDVEASSSIATSLFGRSAYMVTPCRHIFHSSCLEGWLRYRLQCPICRENLPPL